MKKLLIKFFIDRVKIEDLSKGDLEFLYNKFNRELRQYYIEQQLPYYEISKKDKKIMEGLSGLQQSQEYKVLTLLWCNLKNSLGKRLLRKKPSKEYPDIYWKGFYRGQSYLISHTLAFVRQMHNTWQKTKEKNKGEK